MRSFTYYLNFRLGHYIILVSVYVIDIIFGSNKNILCEKFVAAM